MDWMKSPIKPCLKALVWLAWYLPYLNNMPLAAELLQIIETICASGCETVRNVIVEVENGHQVEQISSLSSDEQAIVLAELKAVIAVYDDSDNDGCS